MPNSRTPPSPFSLDNWKDVLAEAIEHRGWRHDGITTSGVVYGLFTWIRSPTRTRKKFRVEYSAALSSLSNMREYLDGALDDWEYQHYGGVSAPRGCDDETCRCYTQENHASIRS